ncbi:hypothetical protein niasHT_010522 [Heterodera trifolii]|uniref:Uncharacterized protein n=1 Tax=Heterodera trifolii TaxID=157864 RepID=A0ABD2L287_9BILA
MGKIGLGENGRRMAEKSMRAAEKTIFESPCLQPEGMRRNVINELESQEERELRKRFATRTPPSGQAFANSVWAEKDWKKDDEGENDEKEEPVFTKIIKIQRKLKEANEELKMLANDVERLVSAKKALPKRERNGTVFRQMSTNLGKQGRPTNGDNTMTEDGAEVAETAGAGRQMHGHEDDNDKRTSGMCADTSRRKQNNREAKQKEDLHHGNSQKWQDMARDINFFLSY